jgi:hypothetical protein
LLVNVLSLGVILLGSNRENVEAGMTIAKKRSFQLFIVAMEFASDANDAAVINYFLESVTFLNLKNGTPLGGLPELVLCHIY